MSDVADRISDQDDAEAARKQTIGQNNNIVFDSLVSAFRERIPKYNERHPQGFGFPNAVVISAGPILESSGRTSHESELKVQKNVAPTSSLTLNFPIMSGAMQVKITSKAGTLNDTIRLDIVSDTPVYDFDGNRYFAEGLADLLLEPIFSSMGTFGSSTGTSQVGRKIGFV